jgi:hypothetical protein
MSTSLHAQLAHEQFVDREEKREKNQDYVLSTNE